MIHTADKVIPSFLRNENLRLIVFCGKGGVGKTTSAAATALYLAKLSPDKKILVLSIDPAHSLGDSFDCPIGAKKTPLAGRSNLWGLEIEPAGLLENFQRRHDQEIKGTIKRAGILKSVNVKELMSLSLPGMEQMMTFIEVANMLESTWFQPSEYDLIVLDTPPTGHLLELLSLPKETGRWVDVFEVGLSHYRIFHPAKVFPYSKRKLPDAVDEFAERMRRDIETVRSLLTDAQQAEFVPVMIPEAMSIAETGDLVAALEERRMPVSSIVVNRIQTTGECDLCSPRREAQRGPIAEIEERFSSYDLIRVPQVPHEVRGERDLTDYATIMTDGADEFNPRQPASSREEYSSVVMAAMPDLLERELQFVLFSGKGGVGKTTMAAATALLMAERHPDKKVLIYSLDPAHSLADSFDCAIGDQVTNVPVVHNLYAAEVDPARLRQSFMDEYTALIRDAFDTWEKKMGVGLERRLDRNSLVTFAKTAPPGLEELLALEQVMEFVEREEYDLYVLDTAPTGHVLGLLKFPQLVRDWLSHAYKGLGKHHVDMPLPHLQTLGDKILKSMNATRKIRKALTDPQKSELVAVTIPEAMAIQETKRLLTAVQDLGVPCRHVVFNMIVPPTECSFCTSRRNEQQEYVRELMDWKPSDHLVGQVPLFAHQVRGLNDLARMSGLLYDEY
ncbi:MAG: ArsA family ATPase [Candidatus Binatia bacterium]